MFDKSRTRKRPDPPGTGETLPGTLHPSSDTGGLGHVVIGLPDRVEAGSWQSFDLIYTAGLLGIEEGGGVQVCFRTPTDQHPPQFDDPAGAGYTRATASNGAVLECRFDPRRNATPWEQTLQITVAQGDLREGDTVTVRFGVRNHGGPGLRMQTYCEDRCRFRVLVDPFSTLDFRPLPVQPTFSVVPGPPVRFIATLPTGVRIWDAFALHIKGEDAWGNPSDQCDQRFALRPSVPVEGLPDEVAMRPWERFHRIEGLRLTGPALLEIELLGSDGTVAARTGPVRALTEPELLPFWADFNGQSAENGGTNSADSFFSFARDIAPVDAVSHLGTGHGITHDIWGFLNELSDTFDASGRFLAVPGYTWSGNTALGGNRIVLFPDSDRRLRRPSPSLIDDKTDTASDAPSAKRLFADLAHDQEWDVVCFAEGAQRHADLSIAHDGRFERSVEVHSGYGSFEWLLHEAFDLGHRVGVVCNSNAQKGRPGAAYPGATPTGTPGGLTCVLMPELTRPALFDALRKRRHYGTTGGPTGRPIIELEARFSKQAKVFDDDPAVFSHTSPSISRTAQMGQIVQLPEGEVTLHTRLITANPIERVDVFAGRSLIATLRPYTIPKDSTRIRIEWQGTARRGRSRDVIWDGGAFVTGNRISRARGVNFPHPDRRLERIGPEVVKWKSRTVGHIAAADLWLDKPGTGKLTINTPMVRETVTICEIDAEGVWFDRSGDLPCKLGVYRLPDQLGCRDWSFDVTVPVAETGDTPIYVRLTQEDGTRAWTSPIYISRHGVP